MAPPMWWWLPLATSVLVALWWLAASPPSGCYEVVLDGSDTQDVPVEQWSSRSMEEAWLREEPVLIKSSPVMEWPAMSWTLPWLAANYHGSVSVSSQRDNGVFVYHNDQKSLHGVEGVSLLKDRADRMRMSLSDFAERLKDNKGKEYLYLSMPVDAISKSLVSECQPSDWITPTGAAEQILWTGTAGVTAHLHFDELFNSYVQVRGSKEFFLCPPTAHTAARLFPWLHPSQRQSQAQIAMGNAVTYESDTVCPLHGCQGDCVTKLACQRALLHPGDLLVVPPYWFHYVVTLEDSISVSSWSEATVELDLADALYSLPLPFEEVWQEEMLVAGITRFFSELSFMFATEVSSTVNLLSHVGRVRYAAVASGYKPDLVARYNSWCSHGDEKWSGQELLNFKEKAVGVVREFVPYVTYDDRLLENRLAIAEILIANYMEVVAEFMLGSERASAYFLACGR